MPLIMTQMVGKTVDEGVDMPFVLKGQPFRQKEKMSNVIRTSVFDREVDVLVVVQQQKPMIQKVQRKTEVMKKIVQTILNEPKTWSPEAKGERMRERRTESLRLMTGA